MGLNDVPGAQRLHIGFFGCRNAGKSSLVNAVTGQDLAVVSRVRGTTTDPVSKAMELLPLGPVVIIDTPGFDDEGMLGEQRIRRTKQTMNKTDIAVLVVDAARGMSDFDFQLLGFFREKGIPHLVAFNKCELLGSGDVCAEGRAGGAGAGAGESAGDVLYVSAATGTGIHELKERLGKLAPAADDRTVAGDLVRAGETAVLVCPIDESAPKGRIILPQQQTLRSILDARATALVVQETELAAALENLRVPPRIVIADSQVLAAVSAVTPQEVPLTTFSILMARYKGFLSTAVAGIAAADGLREGDRILMAEGCTHHRQCNDIGTVKIPRLLQAYCGCSLNFDACSGTEFPDDLSAYAMVIHCGACMNTDRDVRYRMKCTLDQGVPFTNYGIALAQVTGTLERTLRCFPEIHALLEKSLESAGR